MADSPCPHTPFLATFSNDKPSHWGTADTGQVWSSLAAASQIAGGAGSFDPMAYPVYPGPIPRADAIYPNLQWVGGHGDGYTHWDYTSDSGRLFNSFSFDAVLIDKDERKNIRNVSFPVYSNGQFVGTQHTTYLVRFSTAVSVQLGDVSITVAFTNNLPSPDNDTNGGSGLHATYFYQDTSGLTIADSNSTIRFNIATPGTAKIQLLPNPSGGLDIYANGLLLGNDGGVFAYNFKNIGATTYADDVGFVYKLDDYVLPQQYHGYGIDNIKVCSSRFVGEGGGGGGDTDPAKSKDISISPEMLHTRKAFHIATGGSRINIYNAPNAFTKFNTSVTIDSDKFACLPCLNSIEGAQGVSCFYRKGQGIAADPVKKIVADPFYWTRRYSLDDGKTWAKSLDAATATATAKEQVWLMGKQWARDIFGTHRNQARWEFYNDGSGKDSDGKADGTGLLMVDIYDALGKFIGTFPEDKKGILGMKADNAGFDAKAIRNDFNDDLRLSFYSGGSLVIAFSTDEGKTWGKVPTTF